MVNKSLWLALLFFMMNVVIGATAVAGSLSCDQQTDPEKKNDPLIYQRSSPSNDSTLITIPFEYKQSAIFHRFTLDVVDSAISILLKNDSITLTINGFAHVDEGSDTICKYLSLNRAGFIKDYVIGRGVDSARIIAVNAFGNTFQKYKGTDKNGIILNCRVEMRFNYPEPKKPVVEFDTDEDGVMDSKDNCPLIFGYKEKNGCPDSTAIIVPFETRQASLFSDAYIVLDSVIRILKQDPTLTLAVNGHAYKDEGSVAVCNGLSKERAEVVKNYIYSRGIAMTRFSSTTLWGCAHPLNAGKTPMDIIHNSRAELFIVKPVKAP